MDTTREEEGHTSSEQKHLFKMMSIDLECTCEIVGSHLHCEKTHQKNEGKLTREETIAKAPRLLQLLLSRFSRVPLCETP